MLTYRCRAHFRSLESQPLLQHSARCLLALEEVAPLEQIPETLGEDMRFYRSVLFVWLLTDERRCAWHAACFSFHELVACDPYCHCLVCAAAAGLDVFYIPCTFTAYIEAILCRSASLLHSAKAAIARAHVAWRDGESIHRLPFPHALAAFAPRCAKRRHFAYVCLVFCLLPLN